MTFRQWVKYRLYGTLGSFRYFGNRVHFPRACTAFKAVCGQGIFEAHNIRVLQQLCRPNSCMFDIGTNLGLMTIPVLSYVPSATAISFEPSPNALPWLKRTIAGSNFKDRWQLVDKAVAGASGIANFSVSHLKDGLYDGLKYTGLAPQSHAVQVEVTTMDIEWIRLNRPSVSIIKIDVEGGELEVLRGGEKCLSETRAFVLLEWSSCNLRAHCVESGALLRFACERGYHIYALPAFAPVATGTDLELQMINTASFLMVPR